MLARNCYNTLLKTGRKQLPVIFLYNPDDDRYPWHVVCRSHWHKYTFTLTDAVDYAVERGWISADAAKDIMNRVIESLDRELEDNGRR